jgi:RNA polymerase sigma-70 factor (ECF subfamily)
MLNMLADQGQITLLLRRARAGDRNAESEVLTAVYDHLRRIARHQLQGEQANRTLQPTSLVSELYLRLNLDAVEWADRAHFYAVAAKNMRRIIIDEARARAAQRRPPANRRVDLEDVAAWTEDRSAEFLDLNEALERLAEFDPRQAEIVELKFFAGLTIAEIAGVLGFSDRTVKLGWSLARAWLSRFLNESKHPDQSKDAGSTVP